ncbi:UDP-GlcNAc--UDP-phosphate GlcNAc-1-phosphate transferase [uncultured Proteiniphilum sp.]|uniref:UDP-GlcNAc--UDP-phosphate GlcNAc-1-phosphate transferase n=1 Tax=uncultured Proteiniphilum sp. TaxID=497637 RepID=UPI002610AC99|nr:UDP-GlcNAc--UDP-phosphate GlcNAc-1-phosphate transferase [uncultured Proteiniphilum sp.]
MIYLLVIVLLFTAELFYFRFADRYNTKEQNSYTRITLWGGGIIYWVAALLYLSINPSEPAGWFFAGITIMAGVSLWDDVKGLGQKIRLLFHLLAMTCAFYMANVFGIYPWWAIVIGYIVFIGVVNAYNFMDGINGITGLYTLAILLPMVYVNNYIRTFIENDFLIFPLLASVVFLFFNFRKRAKCFAGDVGSVSIAFWIVTLLLLLIIETQTLIWIGFLLVYGVDSVCTILHRIYLKQNIMEAHRLHFYQILANECKTDHREVSLIYFVAQLICSALIITLYPTIGWWIFLILAVTLVIIYGRKFQLMKTTIIEK